MKTAEINIIMDYPFTKKDMETLDIKCTNDLNGWYIYDDTSCFINVASLEFQKYINDNSLINLYVKVDTHEMIHHEIFLITKSKKLTDTEERFVKLMSGQLKWENK